MSSDRDRWRRVKDVFEEVRALPEDRRSAHLAAVCGDDQALQQEVESLLSSYATANDFLEQPAAQVFGGLSNVGTLEGRVLGPYQIGSRVGAGGMGEVYKAHDTRLGRTVAIKVLPAHLATDPQGRKRFEREARAVAALNHPHISTLHDIGAQDGIDFLVMEFLDGETLATRLRNGGDGEPRDAGRPAIKQLIDWVLQIADALGAGHQAGVVHRDVKPGNVIIAANGYAKVLDFGIAKLYADDGDDPSTLQPPRDHPPAVTTLTATGTVIGTSGYMSPEQAQGLPTDHRTDVFSLGCVIYECVTGTIPFEAPSIAERLHRVIHDEPAPLAKAAPQAPEALEPIIRKCLAKNPADRYQSMKNLAVDLQDLRRRLEREPTTSAAAVSGAWRHPGAVRWMAFATVAVAVAAIASTELGQSDDRGDIVGSDVRIQRLTTSGATIDAAISPDGKYLAHVQAVGATQTLHLRNLDTGEDRQVVAAGPFIYYGLAFSPDGASILYTSRGDGHAGGRLMAVPRDFGNPRVLLERILTAVTFSPDGQSFAFLREQYPDQDSSALVIAKADGTEERVLATRRAPDSFAPAFFTAASWSPAGAHIATSVRNSSAQRSQLLVVDVRTGVERELFTSSENVTFTQWLPDGSGILFVSRSFGGFSGQVWLQPYPAGTPRRITTDLLDYRNVSITADGKTLTAVAAEYQAALYSVPLDGSPPMRIRSDRYDGIGGVVPLPDGSLLATAPVKGVAQIVHVSADGMDRTVLTTSGANSEPAVSPDGSFVVFASDRDGSTGIWRMNADGSNQRKLARLAGAAWLSITPDGRQVICNVYRDARPSTWSVPVEGGEAREIVRQFARAVVSPDGKLLGGIYEPPGNGENARPQAAVVPLDGSVPPRLLGPMSPATGTGIFTWAKDGSALIVSSNERFNLFSFGLAGERRQLTDLRNEIFIRGGLTADGQHVAASRGVFHRDAFTLTNFKN